MFSTIFVFLINLLNVTSICPLNVLWKDRTAKSYFTNSSLTTLLQNRFQTILYSDVEIANTNRTSASRLVLLGWQNSLGKMTRTVIEANCYRDNLVITFQHSVNKIANHWQLLFSFDSRSLRITLISSTHMKSKFIQMQQYQSCRMLILIYRRNTIGVLLQENEIIEQPKQLNQIIQRSNWSCVRKSWIYLHGSFTKLAIRQKTFDRLRTFV
jgi:hypothetical protein